MPKPTKANNTCSNHHINQKTKNIEFTIIKYHQYKIQSITMEQFTNRFDVEFQFNITLPLKNKKNAKSKKL